jgi:hypothetical protein
MHATHRQLFFVQNAMLFVLLFVILVTPVSPPDPTNVSSNEIIDFSAQSQSQQSTFWIGSLDRVFLFFTSSARFFLASLHVLLKLPQAWSLLEVAPLSSASTRPLNRKVETEQIVGERFIAITSSNLCRFPQEKIRQDRSETGQDEQQQSDDQSNVVEGVRYTKKYRGTFRDPTNSNLPLTPLPSISQDGPIPPRTLPAERAIYLPPTARYVSVMIGTQLNALSQFHGVPFTGKLVSDRRQSFTHFICCS